MPLHPPVCRLPPTPPPPLADCQLAAAMHADGYEIATHTANHTPMPAGYPFNDTIAEIMGEEEGKGRKKGRKIKRSSPVGWVEEAAWV